MHENNANNTIIMNTATRKKIIDIPESVFRTLTIKSAAKGTNLKNYIENLVIRDAEDLEDAKDYAFLCKNNPEGNIPLDEEQQKAFEKFLGV